MPYKFFAHQQNPLRNEINKSSTIAETKILPILFNKVKLPSQLQEKITHKAHEIIKQSLSHSNTTLVQQLMQEFSLSSIEGLSLMCLAESLLRIPDMPTRLALIREKVRIYTQIIAFQLNYLLYTHAIAINIMIE